MFIKLLDLLFFLCCGVFGGWFFSTQILIPLLRGTALCPVFRKRKVLEHEITEAHEELDEVALEQEAKKLHKKVQEERAK